DDGSRMSGDVHVRICESLGVKFLRATHPFAMHTLQITPHKHRHIIPGYLKIVANPILGGLHHDYDLVPKVA
ncbi:MAG: hypothetical protein WBP02_02835, partial [Gammaproteobacteria bacterium]